MAVQQPQPPQASPSTGRTRGAGLAWFIAGLALSIVASTGSALLVYLMFNRELPASRSSRPAAAERVQGSQRAPTNQVEAAEVPPLGPTLDAGEFVVNLAPGPGLVVHYARLGVVIEADRQAVVEELRRREPQVRDTIISVIRSKRLEDLASSSGTETVRREMVQALQRLASKGRVVNVYFTDFVVQ